MPGLLVINQTLQNKMHLKKKKSLGFRVHKHSIYSLPFTHFAPGLFMFYSLMPLLYSKTEVKIVYSFFSLLKIELKYFQSQNI